jgi:hypothetical protein
MAIPNAVENLIGLPYRYINGPMAGSRLAEGVNCQLLVHLALELLHGINLPPAMMSKEIFEDHEFFEEIPLDTASFGDVFVFGKADETDLRQLHLAVKIDEDPRTQQSLLIHATSIEKAVTVWPLIRFSSYPRYKKLFAVKRLKQP